MKRKKKAPTEVDRAQAEVQRHAAESARRYFDHYHHPLVFLSGAGNDELYRGVGIILMVGIVGAAIVTLTTLPSLTVLVLEWNLTGSA